MHIMKLIKRFIAALLFVFILFPISTEARSYRTKSSDVYVKGYTKKNGTFVSPHYRSAPDGIISNNYSCIDDGRCSGPTAQPTATLPTPQTKPITIPSKIPPTGLQTPLSANSNVIGGYYCNKGYKKNYVTGQCESVSIPLHAKLNYYGNDFICDFGFKRNFLNDLCEKVIIPTNAKLSYIGNDFVCNSGFKRNFLKDSCDQILVPPNAQLNYFGNDFTCNYGYSRNWLRDTCDQVIIPSNAKLNYLGSDFTCDTGFARDWLNNICLPKK